MKMIDIRWVKNRKTKGSSFKNDIVSHVIADQGCSPATAYRKIKAVVKEGIIVEDGKKYKLSS